MAQRKTQSYQSAFLAYRDYADEKEVLLKCLEEPLEGVGTLLDIGAGDGSMAKGVAKLVAFYRAVEQSHDSVVKLRALGLDVSEGTFPFAIPEQFDCVLACHSVPADLAKARGFIDAAWSRVSTLGKLVVVTFDELDDAWHGLLRECKLVETSPLVSGRAEALSAYLEALGGLQIKAVGSHLVSRKEEELVKALEFVYGGGNPEKAREFRDGLEGKNVLKKNYHNGLEYLFPFTHFVFEVRRERTLGRIWRG